MDSTDDSTRSKASTDDDVQSISRSSREQLQDQATALPSSDDAVSMERHRNMMLASLLEDYYRSRALDFLNATNPGQRYTRQSQEVEAVAGRLFGQASQVLSSNGLLSSRSTSDESRRIRQQYLSGLDSLVAGSQRSNILDSMGDLVAQASQLNLAAHPANDLQLTLHQPPPPTPHSHYKSSFREDRLLGKGGFGKVYQCYNFLDQKTYAVKKIVLPPKLVKSVSDGNHDDLQHILREVKAMAVLDHPNIVRYHATWFEKPQQLPELLGELEGTVSRLRSRPQQLLLESHSFTQDDEQESSLSGGIVFGEDTPSHPSVTANRHESDSINRGWSEDASLGLGVIDTTSASETNIFTGGETDEHNSSPSETTLETGVCALYIQMSMYPMTLAQFISPPSASKPGMRHCFHLAPTLRLIFSILEGLQYIHSKGLIHRDIKPGNIFLSSPAATFEGGCCDFSCRVCAGSNSTETSSRSRWLNPRIGDFGLVHQLAQGEVPSSAESSPNSKNDAGTAYYQPPRKGEKKDEKIDIFALGVVLTEMLCRCNTAMERVHMLKGLQRGELPHELRERIEDEGHDSETTDMVIRLVSSMTDEDPEKRWSGLRVREALLDLLQRCHG
ncbi:kinase-like domain-containing protein [Nemania abortiva]|nr:kinase-like domain-containing protein [Nemania abortiva]